MAVHNKIAVYIDGINLTRYVVQPIKWANLLDEQLDEAVISLRNCPKKVIPPLTPVEIRITNSVTMGSSTVYSKSETKYMVVADQPDSNENPVGSGRFDHDFGIIEATKLLERTVVDSITYTNANSKIFTNSAKIVVAALNNIGESAVSTPNTYVSPLAAGNNFLLSSITNIYSGGNDLAPTHNNQNSYIRVISNGDETQRIESLTDTLTIPSVPNGIFTVEYGFWTYASYGGSTTYNWVTVTYTFSGVENKLPLKKWTIKDVIDRLLDIAEPIRQGETPRFKLNPEQAAKFDTIIAPQFSFTKQTLRECLQAIGGVVHGEPRLNVKNDGAGWYYEISYDMYGGTERGNIATRPYYKCTVSQAIESYCTHVDTSAENLVNALAESVGTYYSGNNGVITEPYGNGFKTVRTDTMYARITDSNMHIATQLPIYAVRKLECGFIPNNDGVGAQTVTGSSGQIVGGPNYQGVYAYDGDGAILSATGEVTFGVTPRPTVTITNIIGNQIYYTLDNAESYTFRILFTIQVFTSIDITPYLFEASEYNSRLSSYDSAYPYSKAYGLMYTQGQKNITALNFKEDDPASPVFKNYAIINILEEVTGQSINTDGLDYPLLAFRVTYTPFYSARVAQTKPYYKDFPRGSALIYNQGANVIESRFYGENLKGVIARLGNVEMSRSYRLSRLGLIPKAGQLYNDDYYISAVTVELFTNVINVTIALSKDFNRLSKYIGISSVKRFSEVSQTQAQERNVLVREYVVIGDEETPDNACYIQSSFMEAIRNTFVYTQDILPLTVVEAYGVTYQGTPLPVCILPIISSAFGNSISFEWAYEDNYSAGAISQYAESGSGNTKVSGYFQNNYRYTDYYGKIYYYNFNLFDEWTDIDSLEEQTEIGTMLPASDRNNPTSLVGAISTRSPRRPLILRKDNREIIKVNMQVDFVTNRKGIIIGSALASNNPLLFGKTSSHYYNARLYVFTERLDKFINHLAGSIAIDWNGTTEQTPDLPYASLDISLVEGNQFYLGIDGGKFPGAEGTQYKAWAIVTTQLAVSEQVEDEEGNQSTQTVQYGGDVLLAQNMDFAAGDDFPSIYFTPKREVFDKSVWTTAK